MMESPAAESKRRRTKSDWLHSTDCTESAEDIQRMWEWIQEDSAPLPNQPNPNPEDNDPDFDPSIFPVSTNELSLWHACKVQHPTCVELILQANELGNFKLEGLIHQFDCKLEKNLLLYTLERGSEEDKTYAIIKTLLEYGISPKMEVSMSEIRNPEIVKILEQYQTKTLLFPSHALHLAITKNSPKILELLLENGEHPDPMILTESGSVLPLYPTLAKHLNPIPAIEHDYIIEPCHLLLQTVQKGVLLSMPVDAYHGQPFNNGSGKIDTMKMLLLHGASTSPYYESKGENGSKIMIRDMVFSPSMLRTYIYFRAEEKFLELLKLYVEFGGTLWSKSDLARRVQPEILDDGSQPTIDLPAFGRMLPVQVISLYPRDFDFSNEQSGLVEREVNSMLRVVPSLQHACRVAIRRAMVYPCIRNIETLPLPKDLIKYVKFQTE